MWWFYRGPLAFILSLFFNSADWIDEKTTKPIPAEYWANEKLISKDRMRGLSEQSILSRVVEGVYYLPSNESSFYPQYPIPHLGKDGNIIIENQALYNKDRNKTPSAITRWAEQGKYNLTRQEFQLCSDKKFDYNNTEACKQWRNTRNHYRL